MHLPSLLLELEQLDWPDVEISGFELDYGSDSTGDPALWVWVILRSPDVGFEVRAAVRARIQRWARESHGSDLSWAYVRFRSEAEALAG